jgi:hypothetical protein
MDLPKNHLKAARAAGRKQPGIWCAFPGSRQTRATEAGLICTTVDPDGTILLRGACGLER